MAKYAAYDLKELVWFHEWTPSHWVLIVENETLKARCTWSGKLRGGNFQRHNEIPMTEEMLGKIERAVAGSIPAVMGFEFVICDGQPGSAVLNKPLNFTEPNPDCPEASDHFQDEFGGTC